MNKPDKANYNRINYAPCRLFATRKP